jgi:hypothetical protein
MSYESKNLPVARDGFGDVDDENFGSLIENPPKVKFGNDAQWTRGEEAIPPNREFLVIKILRVLQHWVNQLPTDKSYVLKPEEHWPDVEALNKGAPPEEWRDHYNKRVGPWQKAYVVYLLDPHTLEVFTYPTSTAGGFRAVRELRKSTDRARLLRGPTVVPRVTLADTFFPVYGGRQRPHFHIVGFEPFGPGQAPAQLEGPRPGLPGAEAPFEHHDRREHGATRHEQKPEQKLDPTTASARAAIRNLKTAKSPTLSEELDDEIDF